MIESLEDNSNPISVSEAYHLLVPLKSRYKNARTESYQIFKKTLEYTDTFCRIRDKTIAADLKSYLMDLGFNGEETSAFGSLLPQNADEAKLCIPSIVRLEDDVINKVIKKIGEIMQNN